MSCRTKGVQRSAYKTLSKVLTLSVFDNYNDSLCLVGLTFKIYCRLCAHLETLEFDVSIVATEWFLCLFAKSLPSEVKLLILPQ